MIYHTQRQPAQGHGNQHSSRRKELMSLLIRARGHLDYGRMATARLMLALFWSCHANAPASTRRRWRCGR